MSAPLHPGFGEMGVGWGPGAPGGETLLTLMPGDGELHAGAAQAPLPVWSFSAFSAVTYERLFQSYWGAQPQGSGVVHEYAYLTLTVGPVGFGKIY